MQKLSDLFSFLFVKHRTKTVFILCFLLIIRLLNNYFSSKEETKQVQELVENSYHLDLPEILRKGKLTVLAENSSTSFFIYRGKKMGFEYEVLKQFANELGVYLEVKIVDDLDQLMERLNKGEGDIIACNFTVTKERSKIIDFSIPTMRTHQVLIQRKPDNWKKMNPEQLRGKMLNDPSQLAHRKVVVWEHSSYHQRLLHLQEEIGDTIYIQGENGQTGAEELIEMVSEGMIDYTVAEANLARINQRFYENIDINLGISVKQKIAFGVRKSSPLLKARLDKWLESFMRKTTFKYIKHKYYDLAQISTNSQTEFSSLKGGQLSMYDAFFKKAAKKYNWDWRLLAALSYQESKFNPNVVSFGGAYSMMQFMPETGPTYGVYPNSSPEIQILGGMKKLYADYNSWTKVTDPVQKQKFALASYNSGRGHVADAQRLAIKHGKNPLIWDNNVETMMLNLSKKEYYRDPVVKSGAAKGMITCRYVREVMDRYQMWKSLFH